MAMEAMNCWTNLHIDYLQHNGWDNGDSGAELYVLIHHWQAPLGSLYNLNVHASFKHNRKEFRALLWNHKMEVIFSTVGPMINALDAMLTHSY